MTNKQYEDCQLIIHSASVASGAAGALPIPGSDSVAICAAQTAMIIALGKVFDIRMTESAAEAMVITRLTEFAGKLMAGGFIKMIPGVGTFIGGCVNATVAVSITEMVGWEVAEDFDRQAA